VFHSIGGGARAFAARVKRHTTTANAALAQRRAVKKIADVVGQINASDAGV